MKFRPSSWFAAVSWTLIVALAVSPLMAQETQSAPAAATEENAPVSAPMVHEFKITPAGSTLSALSGNSTPKTGTQPGEKADAPGQSKWVVLAAIIGTGAAVGIYFLLRGFGGGDDPKRPSGTIISAGQPTVAAPAR